jgi:hypothetical protein
MKKLALLLLTLPLAACASPMTSKERSAQVAEARNVCTHDPEGEIPDTLDPQCVNKYLQSHYGYQLVTQPDGSLAVWHYHYVGTPAYF